MRKLLLILTAVIMLSCVEPISNNDFEKSVIRAELPTQADVPNSQPQAEPPTQPQQEIIIEEVETPEIEIEEVETPPENYLMIGDFRKFSTMANDDEKSYDFFIGTYENKYGEVFEFFIENNARKFRYWDLSHKGTERKNSNFTYNAPPTMEGYVRTLYTNNINGFINYFVGNNTYGLTITTQPQIFTTYEYRYKNINYENWELYLNDIQFVRRWGNKTPVFE